MKVNPETNPFYYLVSAVEEYAIDLAKSGESFEDADIDEWELSDMIRGWDAEEVLELGDLMETDAGGAQLDAAALFQAKGDNELAGWIATCAAGALSGARDYWAQDEVDDNEDEDT